MCHSCANNGKINRLHNQSSFEMLLEKDGSVSVHNRNLQILATEMCKTKNDLSPLIVTELFEQRNEQHFDLRKNYQFTIPPVRTIDHGSESISFIGPKIWNILPDRLKNVNSIEAKMQIKNGSLKIVHVRFTRFMFKMSVLFKSISIEGKERKLSCEI